MSSTPLICSSRGIATVLAIVCGSAPGYDARTNTLGGDTFGYRASGSWVYASAPKITITTDITHAKIGRSMKNRANIIN